MTVQNSYLEGCGIESRADHADIIQCSGCGDGDVINHNTMNNGAAGFTEDSADFTFSADGGYGSTWTNNFLIRGPGATNSKVGLDNRVDSGGLPKGTLILRNNVFENLPSGSFPDPLGCGAGPKASGLTVLASGNKSVSGATINPDGACGVSGP
jgi:hypothetical protein